MARFSLPFLLLACTAGKDSGADCVSDDPCDCGVAWTERRGPVATIQDAVNGAQSGETVYLCEGEIKGTIYFPTDAYPSEETYTDIRLVGAGIGRTTLTTEPEDEVDRPVIVAVPDPKAQGPTLTISDCTITGGRGMFMYHGSDGYDRSTFGGGMWLCGVRLTLERVELTDNVAHLGGGLTTFCAGNTGLTDITLIDSSVTDNSGRGGDEGYSGGGGAWLADDFILTSVNTDWGTGDTDNRDDDIAIGPFGGPYTSYTDFGAAENFVCTSEAQACTRTE